MLTSTAVLKTLQQEQQEQQLLNLKNGMLALKKIKYPLRNEESSNQHRLFVTFEYQE